MWRGHANSGVHRLASLSPRASSLDGLTLALAPCLSPRCTRRFSTVNHPTRSQQHRGDFLDEGSPSGGSGFGLSAGPALPGGPANSQRPKRPGKSSDRARPRSPPQRPRAPPLLRLDPDQPIVRFSGTHRRTPARTSSPDDNGTVRADPSVVERSRAIAQLHVALESGNAEAVFQAYLRVPKDDLGPDPARLDRYAADEGGRDGGTSSAASSIRSSLTAREMRLVLRRLISGTPKLHQGMLRLVAIVEEIKRRRSRAVALAQRAEAAGRRSEFEQHVRQVLEWDQLLDARTINAMIAFTGRCVRAAGPAEVDEALSLLLDTNLDLANLATSSMASPSSTSAATANATSLRARRTSPAELSSLRLQQSVLGPRLQKFMQKQSAVRKPFPDITTYNTILDIVCRSVHPFRPGPSQAIQQDADDDYGHDPDRIASLDRSLVSQFADGEGSAAELSTNMERLGLEAESGVYTTSTARKIFDALLDRMRLISRIEPDRITYNIILTMHCRLGRWDAVEDTIGSMLDDGLLGVADLNTVMWRWASSAQGAEARWKRTEEVDRVYQLMRDNLVRFKRQLKRQQRRPRSDPQASDDKASGASGHRQPGVVQTLPDRDDGFQTRAQASGTLPQQSGDRDLSQGSNPHARSPNLHEPHNARNRSTADPEPAPTEDEGELDRILRIGALPAYIVPNGTTYALLIKLQTFAGDFAGALSTFRHMLSTPHVDAQRLADGTVTLVSPRGGERFYSATMGILSSFFRGFSKHGRPMRLVYLDQLEPLRSEWEPYEDDRDTDGRGVETDVHTRMEARAADWNVQTLGEIFEAFLRLRPVPLGGPESTEAFFSTTPSSRRPSDADGRGEPTAALSEEVTELQFLPDGSAGPPSLRARLGRTAHSILSSRDSGQLSRGLTQLPAWAARETSPPPAHLREWETARRAPSTNELFFLLTALRRVSGDHPSWTLAMWEMVEDKFASGPLASASLDGTDPDRARPPLRDERASRTDGGHEEGSRAGVEEIEVDLVENPEGWVGFRTDARIERVLTYLRDKEIAEQG